MFPRINNINNNIGLRIVRVGWSRKYKQHQTKNKTNQLFISWVRSDPNPLRGDRAGLTKESINDLSDCLIQFCL